MHTEGRKSAESVANALNALEAAKLVGAIDPEMFSELIVDYFGGQDPVSSDNEMTLMMQVTL